jgi:hypothetical protein
VRDADVHLDANSGVMSIQSTEPGIRMSYALPTKYDRQSVVQGPPFPLIVTLHEPADTKDAYPGAVAIARRWDRTGPLKPIREEWLVFAPWAPRGQFTEDGDVKRDAVPLWDVWTRYHVDFDRIVLEGGADAITVASGRNNYFFAGVIVRDPRAELPDSALPALKSMLALPVYVVGGLDDSPVVKFLAKGGHTNVKKGPPEGLVEWLQKLPKRPTLKTLDVAVRGTGLVGWVNVNALDETAGEKSMKVEAIDTKEDPNTIRITAKGVRDVSLFLNDRIVDLDRPVRVVANGKEVQACRIEEHDSDKEVKLPSKFERRLDTTFVARWGSIRRGMYFGALFPTQLLGIVVPEPAPPAPAGSNASANGDKPPEPTEPAAVGDAEQREKDAVQYLEKAEAQEAQGNLPVALKLYKKALDQGKTSVHDRAEAKVKELEERGVKLDGSK